MLSQLIIKRLDTSTSVTLTYSNSGVSETHRIEVSELPILYTSQPIVKPKYSKSEYTIPGVLLFKQGESVTSEYEYLVNCTKPTKEGDFPKLEVIWVDFKLDMCYLTELSVSRKMSVGGTLTLAEMELTFALAPEVPKPKVAPKTPTTGATQVKLTEREREDYAKQVVAKLKTDAKLAKEYEFKPTSAVKVDPTGNVTIDGRVGATLQKLGITIKPSHKTKVPKDTKTVPTGKGTTGTPQTQQKPGVTSTQADRNPVQQRSN